MVRRMAKIFTQEEIELLSKNPNVKDIRTNRITFTFEFKHRLWEEWKNDQSTACIRRVLISNGLDPHVLGTNKIVHLNEKFKINGEPSRGKNKVFGKSAINFRTDEDDNEFLISTGIFIRGKSGISFSNSFIDEAYHFYPDSSIESLLENHGIDPDMVGYQRIYQLKNRIEGNGNVRIPSSYSDETVQKYKNHPYIKRINHNQFTLDTSFYNEALPYKNFHIDDILDMFEIDHKDIGIETRNRIKYKLNSWTVKSVYPVKFTDTALFNKIMINKEKRLIEMIKNTFSETADKLPQLKKKGKRKLCEWIRDFPYMSRKTFTVSGILKKLRISKSDYYAILDNEHFGDHEEALENRNDEDIKVIKAVLESEKYPMGYRMVYMKMMDVTGIQFGLNRVRRLMNLYGLNPKVRRGNASRKSANDLLKRNVKPNLLKRQFRFERPFSTFLSDVSYLKYSTNKTAYFSPIKDAATGRILGAVVSEANDLKLGTDTLLLMENIEFSKNAIFHTDQGAIYLNDSFQKKVKELGLRESMSRRGNCWDNASQESFFGHFKDECSYSHCNTIDELRKEIYEYIDYYNYRRPQWTRNKMTPFQYEKYLNDMNDEEFSQYQAEVKKKYDRMMEEAKKKAINRAHDIGA